MRFLLCTNPLSHPESTSALVTRVAIVHPCSWVGGKKPESVVRDISPEVSPLATNARLFHRRRIANPCPAFASAVRNDTRECAARFSLLTNVYLRSVIIRRRCERGENPLIELCLGVATFVPAPDDNQIVFGIDPDGVVARALCGVTGLWCRGPAACGVQPPEHVVIRACAGAGG